MSDWAIETHAMSRRFADYWAVKNLDLQINRGSIYGFLGPNGSGKSTAIRLLTGLLTPSSGQVQVLGQSLPAQAERIRRQLGYMTQKFSLYDSLTVLENLNFVGQIYGLPARACQQRVSELLQTYQLADKQRVRAAALSGGQKQRLALAAAVLHRPALLFLDEPTSAVDPQNRREFWQGLFDLSEQGTTILVSTHYMDEAERCHQLAILEQGEKRADGSPQQLMAQMNALVIEVSAADLRTVRQQLSTVPAVLSAAQLGNRLRVLWRPTGAGLAAGANLAVGERQAVGERLAGNTVVSTQSREALWQLQQLLGPQVQLALVRPSLEDVFVANTGAAYAQRQAH